MKITDPAPKRVPSRAESGDAGPTLAAFSQRNEDRRDSHRVGQSTGAHSGTRQSDLTPYHPGLPAGMIAWPGGTLLWIAAGVTDLRRRFTGLSTLMQTALDVSNHQET